VSKRTQNTIDWTFSRKHLMIMNWWAPSSPVRNSFGILLDGSIRSGKTLPGSCSYTLWSFYAFPNGGQRFFFAGKTIGTVRRNVVDPLYDAAPYLGLSIVDHRTDNMIEICDANNRKHEFHLFGGNDERSQSLIRGFTGAGGFFDEATEMPESFVNMALSRLSVEGATAWFTTNPDNPNHWFKKDFIDRALEKNLIYLHLTMRDNLSLSEAVLARYESLYSGVFYRRFIKGEWCAAEGVVYPEFISRDDLVFDFNGDWSQYGEMAVSCDYGTQNAHVYLLFAWHIERKRWEAVKEWYQDGRGTGNQMSDNEKYDALLSFVGNLPVRDVIIDPSAASFAAMIRKAKRFRPVGADNDVSNGIAYTASLFHINKLAVCLDCKMLIAEIGGYRWDSKQVDKGKDVPVKEHDHSVDALRYFAFTHIRRYEKRYGILISREAA